MFEPPEYLNSQRTPGNSGYLERRGGHVLGSHPFESIASPEVRDDILFDFAILANRANDADILVDSAIGRRNFDRSNEHVIIITMLNPIANAYIR